MAKSYTKEWPILDREEDTQSNTYMPLICSVMDGFEVDFPPEYPALFSEVARDYNKIETLPFKNFVEFQTYLKARAKKIGLDRRTFFDNCDDKNNYHIEAGIQQTLMGVLDGFFGLFIPKLIKFASDKYKAFKKADTMLTCRLRDTLHLDYARGEASRYAEFDAAEVARKAAAHERKEAEYAAHKAAARDSERASHSGHKETVTYEWYAVAANGVQEDYSDEVNRQINEHLGSGEPPFMTKINGHTYLIDTENLMEENLTGERRAILKKRWYYQDRGGLTPYPDHINDEIMKTKKGQLFGFYNQGIYYNINPLTKTETNDRTREFRRIVYEGGNKKTKRTKRRRSLYKRTRHHA